MRHGSELLVPGFGSPVLCRGKTSRARGMAAYVRHRYGAFWQLKFDCGCREILGFIVCGVRQNIYVFSLNRNHDLNDRNFDCLQTSMAAVQAEDVSTYYLFVGDLNARHQEWVGSTTTNRYDVELLTSQLCLVAISWLSARSMHVVEHLIS